MKTLPKSVLLVAAVLWGLTAAAQNLKDIQIKYTEASDLTLIGKIMDTPNPYHRVDTVAYKGFTKGENIQVRCPSGIAVLFRTDSRVIAVQSEFGYEYRGLNTMPLAYRGYDLYIKKDGRWLWAGCNAPGFDEKSSVTTTIARDMDGSMHECLLYLPLYSELYHCRIAVEEGSTIEAIQSPFRGRVAIFGSSFTQGISCSRAGMTYPAQFTRHTGIQLLSLGCSGNCKMQDYFAAVLADVEADAYIFDAFSNPLAPMIQERLFPFIEALQAAHPGKPLIFQQTIDREKCNFSVAHAESETAKIQMAEKLMKEACRKYKDVYFVRPDATAPLHEATVDGVHPDDYGYYLWTTSIEKPVLKILRKYGIR